MTNLNLLALLLLTSSIFTLSVKDFQPALFSSSQSSGFYNVDTGTPNSGQILAFTDLNGDKYTDYLATNDRTMPSIQAYIWDPERSLFTNQVLPINPPIGSILQQIMPCDINADGISELVVTYLISNTYTSQIYQSTCGSSCQITQWNTNFTLLTDMEALPFIFDRFSNGSVSILTFKNGQRVVVSVVSQKTTIYSQPWDNLVTNNPTSFSSVSEHFASQIDINGDCFSDMVLLSSNSNMSQLQLYIKNNHNSYYYTLIPLNKNITWLSFADLDRNGATDMFLISHEQGKYIPLTMLNQNIPEDICQTSNSLAYQVNKMHILAFPSEYNLMADSNIKIGDFNFDGYPDLLGIFSINSFRTVSILENKGGLRFNIIEDQIGPLHQITNPHQACLYDFNQNGQFSVLVISKATKDNGSIGYLRTSIINNLIEDTLFIKILPLLPSSSDDFTSTSLANAIGVTIQWRLTNLDGDKTISTVNQKSQWNHGTLQLPFATHGLGRTNNYIQDLSVGYSGYGQKNQWTPVIPNSQLILLPKAEDEWVLQTLLKDNSRVYDVIYISILCLVGLGILILFLNWRQTQQDKRDHYNFIQMIR